MQGTTKVLIKLGRTFSAVGTATVIQDEDSGRRMLHMQLAALSPDIYLPLSDVPPLARDVDEPEVGLLGATIVGHA